MSKKIHKIIQERVNQLVDGETEGFLTVGVIKNGEMITTGFIIGHHSYQFLANSFHNYLRGAGIFPEPLDVGNYYIEVKNYNPDKPTQTTSNPQQKHHYEERRWKKRQRKN